jgi:hypothetical protein
LSINVNQPFKFAYNILVNGPIPKNATTVLSGTGNNLSVTVAGHPPMALYVAGQYATEVYPSDFWGEYTLAK